MKNWKFPSIHYNYIPLFPSVPEVSRDWASGFEFGSRFCRACWQGSDSSYEALQLQPTVAETAGWVLGTSFDVHPLRHWPGPMHWSPKRKADWPGSQSPSLQCPVSSARGGPSPQAMIAEPYWAGELSSLLTSLIGSCWTNTSHNWENKRVFSTFRRQIKF